MKIRLNFFAVFMILFLLTNIKIVPQNTNSVETAKLLMLEGKYYKSIDTLRNVLKRKEESAKVFYLLALNFQALSDFNNAIINLESALKYNPADANVLMLLGNCYFNSGRFLRRKKFF